MKKFCVVLKVFLTVFLLVTYTKAQTPNNDLSQTISVSANKAATCSRPVSVPIGLSNIFRDKLDVLQSAKENSQINVTVQVPISQELVGFQTIIVPKNRSQKNVLYNLGNVAFYGNNENKSATFAFDFSSVLEGLDAKTIENGIKVVIMPITREGKASSEKLFVEKVDLVTPKQIEP